MKYLLLSFLLFSARVGSAQYYYKDIIGTGETAEMMRTYTANKIKKVVLNSYDADGTRNADFVVTQVFDGNALTTSSKSGDEDASVLTSYVNSQGQVIKTVDSSDALISTTTYTYNDKGWLTSVLSVSADLSRSFSQTELHRWEYNDGRIARMVRIKNGSDSSNVQFKFDERGNVSEEQLVRRGVKSDPVYYYYDAQNRLTDIVRYNNKVKRLLPEYMFEYSANNQVIQKITVPGNSSNYLIWRYQYGADGLKTKEAIYNRQKQLTGKIEYIYQRG